MDNKTKTNQENGEELEKISKYLLEEYFKEELERQKSVEIGISKKKEHKFDLGNYNYLIECKYCEWTKGRNNPSGKISTLREVILYFLLAPKNYKKILVLNKSSLKNNETILDYFLRLNKHLISDDFIFFEVDMKNNTMKNKSIKESE